MMTTTPDDHSALIISLRNYGVGKRTPDDPFFNDGNRCFTFLERLGVVEEDNENYLHEILRMFTCSVANCTLTFDTVFSYEQHYNISHRHTCSECNKSLETAHLLDLHLSETHDSFFAVQAERKPMYRCFVEECPAVFPNAPMRKSHSVEDHNFPQNFRTESKHQKGKKKGIPSKAQNTMEVDRGPTAKCTISRVLGRRRQGKNELFTSFAKDLSENLPK